MSDERESPPVPGATHVNAATATLMVPPRPELPSRDPQRPAAAQPPPLPPGWTVASAGAVTPSRPMPRVPSTRARSATFWPRVLLGLYLFVLTGIALWPVPVDSGAGPALRLIARVFPVLTHARLEFGANILLFVPLGVLLALILQQRHLVVPIAFIATVAIESMQALMIDRRVPSVMDIIANVAGACVGLVIVALVEWWRARR